jgi:hypothetical protein
LAKKEGTQAIACANARRGRQPERRSRRPPDGIRSLRSKPPSGPVARSGTRRFARPKPSERTAAHVSGPNGTSAPSGPAIDKDSRGSLRVHSWRFARATVTIVSVSPREPRFPVTIFRRSRKILSPVAARICAPFSREFRNRCIYEIANLTHPVGRGGKKRSTSGLGLRGNPGRAASPRTAFGCGVVGSCSSGHRGLAGGT